MKEYSEVFVGMDVSKSRIAVGLADGGGVGEARFSARSRRARLR